MIKVLKNNFKNFDKITNKVLKNGLKFCFILCIISVFVLLTYILIFKASYLYYIGINLFKFSLIFAIEFIICSFVVDKIKKQLI